MQIIKRISIKNNRCLFLLLIFITGTFCLDAQTLPPMPPSGFETEINGIFHGMVSSTLIYKSKAAGNQGAVKVYTPPGY